MLHQYSVARRGSSELSPTGEIDPQVDQLVRSEHSVKLRLDEDPLPIVVAGEKLDRRQRQLKRLDRAMGIKARGESHQVDQHQQQQSELPDPPAKIVERASASSSAGADISSRPPTVRGLLRSTERSRPK